MNGSLGDIWTLAWTFGLLSLFAIGGAASAIPARALLRKALEAQRQRPIPLRRNPL